MINTDTRSRAASRPKITTISTQDVLLEWISPIPTPYQGPTIHQRPTAYLQGPPPNAKEDSSEEISDRDDSYSNQNPGSPPNTEPDTKPEDNQSAQQSNPPQDDKHCFCLAAPGEECNGDRIGNEVCLDSKTACCVKTTGQSSDGLTKQSAQSISSKMIEAISKWFGF